MTMTSGGRQTDLRALAAGPWVVVDDGVMGGRSAGAVSEDDGVTVFSGTLSLENNGGFSSVRLPLSQSLRGYSGLRIKVRGDGRTYQLRLREGNRFDGVSWGTSFASSSEWTTMDIPFGRFRPTFRGRAVPQSGPVVAERIGQIGILLGDKNPGPFRLEVAALEGIAAAEGK
ncbi:MAG: CIA30 family protein [Pseudomonadota bacterium]